MVNSSSEMNTNVDTIVPEIDSQVPQVELLMESRVSPVVDAIVSLKGYCVEAKKLIEHTGMSDKLQGVSSLVQLITKFGDASKPGADVVSEFADVILQLRSEDNGLFDYFIKNINNAVLNGKSPVEPFQNDEGHFLVTFNHDVVGLQLLPEVFQVQLAVKNQKWGAITSILKTEVAQTWDPLTVNFLLYG